MSCVCVICNVHCIVIVFEIVSNIHPISIFYVLNNNVSEKCVCVRLNACNEITDWIIFFIMRMPWYLGSLWICNFILLSVLLFSLLLFCFVWNFPVIQYLKCIIMAAGHKRFPQKEKFLFYGCCCFFFSLFFFFFHVWKMWMMSNKFSETWYQPDYGRMVDFKWVKDWANIVVACISHSVKCWNINKGRRKHEL